MFTKNSIVFPLTILALMVIGGLANMANADVLADLTLEEWTNTDASGGDMHLNPPYSATSVLDAGITSIAGRSVSSAGGMHGVGGAGSNAGEINWSNWTRKGGGTANYFSFEIVPNASLYLDDITYSIARNGAGAPKDLYVWVVDGAYAGATLDIANAAANVQLTSDGLDVQRGGITTNNPKAFDLSGVAPQENLFSIVLGARWLDDEAANAVGNLRINDVVINGTGQAPQYFSLEVNKTTGQIKMFNDAGNTNDFSLDFYKILSAGDALDNINWNSMEDQDHDGNGAPNDGIGWEEVGEVSSSFLGEANLTGESLFTPGDEVNLGKAYDTTSDIEDLVFTYRLPNGVIKEGIVTYVTSSIILGDVNGDGLVNGFDVDPFVSVLLNGPYQVEADVNEDGAVNGFDVDPFVALVLGGGSGGGSGPQGTEVPEPTTLALLGLGGLAVLRRRKK